MPRKKNNDYSPSADMKEKIALTTITAEVETEINISNETGGITEQPNIEIITAEIQSYKNQAGEAIYEIGKRLIQVKKQLGYGLWLEWLHDSVDIPERMAQRYIKVAQKYSNPKPVSDLGFTKAYILASLPESERKDFIESIHDVDGKSRTIFDMSKRELEKALHDRKPQNTKIGSTNKSDMNNFPPIHKSSAAANKESEESIGIKYDFDTDFEYVQTCVNGILENIGSTDDSDDTINKYYDALSALCNRVLKNIPVIDCIQVCIECVLEYLECELEGETFHNALLNLSDKIIEFIPATEPKSVI